MKHRFPQIESIRNTTNVPILCGPCRFSGQELSHAKAQRRKGDKSKTDRGGPFFSAPLRLYMSFMSIFGCGWAAPVFISAYLWLTPFAA